MKLFWKIFLSVVTVTTVVFCISGHVLIHNLFRSLLENEIELAKMANVSFCYSLMENLQIGRRGELSEWQIKNQAENIELHTADNLLQIRLYNAGIQPFYEMQDSEKVKGNKKLLQEIEKNSIGYEIKETDHRYYLYIANAVALDGTDIYAESVYDITEVFRQKDRQYQLYMRSMLILVGITSVLVLILSLWITRPIKRLAKTAKEMGEGNFIKRHLVYSEDEIGELAKEFDRMSNQIEQKIEELREAVIRQEEFTGSFAHELKTPLTSIVGYADMIRSRKMDEETRMIYGNYIFQQGKRLESLSKKMLDLMILGKTDFVMRDVWLEDILEQIQDELRIITEERNIVLVISVEGMKIKAEPDLLKSVFINMIDNSMKAIGENGQIRIWAEKNRNETIIYIEDDGRGIPAEDIEKVTESFYMVDKSRKYEGGSAGLGLAICKKVLELHHAELTIESEIEKGTKMVICFGGEL